MKVFLRFGNVIVILLILLFCIIAFREIYLSDDIVISEVDYDNDGVDDYTDILNGAKEFASLNPQYGYNYYEGGYPTDSVYTNTDVLWYSLMEAGYNFKDLIDEDIENNLSDYDIEEIDSNTDFRQLANILVYLDKYCEKLDNYDDFNPGDIIVYYADIAIVSDKTNGDGNYYIIHHDGLYNYEEDKLYNNVIIGHYRWNLS